MLILQENLNKYTMGVTHLTKCSYLKFRQPCKLSYNGGYSFLEGTLKIPPCLTDKGNVRKKIESHKVYGQFYTKFY